MSTGPMTIEHSLERVIVIPRNGYVNRLQSWASAAILGAQLDVGIKVLWEPERIAPALSTDLFTQQRVHMSFIDSAAASGMIGRPHEDLPRYLHVDRDRRLVTLAGHDRGEQAFMEPLADALADPCEPNTLIIIAGGKFHLPESGDFDLQRRMFYEHIEWSNDISERVRTELDERDPYVALHIRETDRSRQAPTSRAVRTALLELGARTGIRTLFIAADNRDSREHWTRIAGELAFTPWWTDSANFDRAQSSAGISAMVDWVILGHARGSVYSSASSFAAEAAVASGYEHDSIGLTASLLRQRLRAAIDHGQAAITYPRRKGWIGT